MLSSAAFNALLKILEEPPEHLVFILATTEIHKVPATILSRCQRYSFKRIQPGIIANRLNYIAGQENISISGEASELLARLADGSMRDALSLLDQCITGEAIDSERVLSAIGLAGAAEIEQLLISIQEHDAAQALTILDRLYQGGKDVVSVLNELMSLMRDILLIKIAHGAGAGPL